MKINYQNIIMHVQAGKPVGVLPQPEQTPLQVKDSSMTAFETFFEHNQAPMIIIPVISKIIITSLHSQKFCGNLILHTKSHVIGAYFF